MGLESGANEDLGTAKCINYEISEQSLHTDGPRGWLILFCNFSKLQGGWTDED